MRNDVAILFAALVVTAPFGAARADEPPTTEAILSDAEPASLAGEVWYGLHLNGRSVGTLKVTFTPDAQGLLEGRLESRFTLSGVKLGLTEVDAVGPGWVTQRLVQTTREGDEPPEEVAVERRADRLHVTADGRTWSHAPGAAPIIVGQLGRIALARALQRAKAPAGRYTTTELELDDGDGPDEDGNFATAIDVMVELDPARPGARRVTLTPRDDPADAWVALVGPDGALESFGRAAEPGLVYLRAADEAVARRDRPDAGVPPDSPRGVVLEYLRGLVLADPAKVEAAIDWPALHRALGADDAGQDVAAFKRAFLEGLAGAKDELDLGPDDVEALGASLTEELAPDGAVAWVTIPGEDHRVRLGRTGPGGAWRIHTMID